MSDREDDKGKAGGMSECQSNSGTRTIAFIDPENSEQGVIASATLCLVSGQIVESWSIGDDGAVRLLEIINRLQRYWSKSHTVN